MFPQKWNREAKGEKNELKDKNHNLCPNNLLFGRVNDLIDFYLSTICILELFTKKLAFKLVNLANNPPNYFHDEDEDSSSNHRRKLFVVDNFIESMHLN